MIIIFVSLRQVNYIQIREEVDITFATWRFMLPHKYPPMISNHVQVNSEIYLLPNALL